MFIYGHLAGSPTGIHAIVVVTNGASRGNWIIAGGGGGAGGGGSSVPGQAPIPTLTEWGLIILTLLLLTVGTIYLRRRRLAMAFGT